MVFLENFFDLSAAARAAGQVTESQITPALQASVQYWRPSRSRLLAVKPPCRTLARWDDTSGVCSVRYRG